MFQATDEHLIVSDEGRSDPRNKRTRLARQDRGACDTALVPCNRWRTGRDLV